MSSSLQVSDNAGIATSSGTKTEKSKASKKSSPAVTFQSNFSHILDARLLRGLSNLGHTHPTLVQAAAIPVALGGKSLAATEESLDGLGGNEDGSSGFRDLLVRARTGTGKTLAYGLPLMQKILDAKKALDPSDPTYRSTRALVLVPTRELSEQVYNQLRTLAEACGGRSSTSFNNAKSAAAHRQSIGAEVGLGEDAGEDAGADGEEEGGSKRGLKGKGKAKDVGSSSLDTSDHNTTGEAPIEILNIARDDIKPKIIKMLLGRTGSGGEGSSSSRSSRHQQPDILVSTPSKLLQLLQKRGSEAGSGLDLSNLESLVIDEADFMLAYGHDMLGSSDASEDGSTSGGGFIKQVLQAGWWTKAEAKGGVQRFLISATLNSDVEKLKGLILRRPVVLDMKDSLLASASDDASAQNQQQLLQYSLHLSEVDKFLLLYVILKLRLIRGKTLIFVNSIERGYRLKLFLEQFGITKSAVLNHELPFNTRMKKVEAFNKDAIAVMIATDEVGAAEGMQDLEEEEEDSDEGEEEGEETAGKKRKRGDAGKRSAKKQKNSTAATEYSVSRGVDFLQVACVINFDMPTSLIAYTHRVGRTARAGNTGTALSFVVPKELVGKTTGQLSGKNMKHLCCSTAKFDESVWKKVQSAYSGASDAEKANAAGKNTIQEWKYDKAQIEAFRYRMEDALRSVTKLAIKDARVKELKWEMLNSEKLKSYWEDNPKDLEYLKAQTQDLSGGKMLGGGKVQSHLKHVPGYLMPRIAGFKSGNGSNGSGGIGRSNTGYVPKHGNKGAAKGNGKKQQGGRKKQDPLKKFKAK